MNIPDNRRGRLVPAFVVVGLLSCIGLLMAGCSDGGTTTRTERTTVQQSAPVMPTTTTTTTKIRQSP